MDEEGKASKNDRWKNNVEEKISEKRRNGGRDQRAGDVIEKKVFLSEEEAINYIIGDE